MTSPSFLVTVDTEGDNLWAKPRTITTRNAAFLPRFQALCERYGIKPTYLVNHEMACCGTFREFARDILRRGAGEIGMHLHAWNSPPVVPLTLDDFRAQPYLIEYPEPVMREKVRRLTGLLEETFGVKMRSHRAGRWSLNETYARILVEHGYRVDCSVTPHVSWRQHLGDPAQRGGTDYSSFPSHPYFMDLDDISRPGPSPLLEVPVTIVARGASVLRRLPPAIRERRTVRRILARVSPPVWLRPRRGNLDALLRVVARAIRRRTPYLQMMLHSSELMPGGSPTFESEEAVEELHETLERLFETIKGRYAGRTLTEFYELFGQWQRGKGAVPWAGDVGAAAKSV